MTQEEFLAKIDEIEQERPAYRPGGDGSDGTCDCVGLYIGAIRRCGLTWAGLHGSNYAVRREIDGLSRADTAAALRVGDIVFKAREPGEAGYALPARYAEEPDRRDYYHTGVVRAVNPLEIVHCTTPTVIRDQSLGRWAYHGRLRRMEDEKMSVRYQAEVVTESTALNLRDAPQGKKMGSLPRGAVVDVLDDSGTWWRIEYGGMTGYASAAYLLRTGEPENDADGMQTQDATTLVRADGVTIALKGEWRLK